MRQSIRKQVQSDIKSQQLVHETVDDGDSERYFVQNKIMEQTLGKKSSILQN